MQLIVLDLEWNQAYPGIRHKYAEHIDGEIIQIGAVRMSDDGKITEEYQTFVCPQYYYRLNHRVSKLTGIKESMLRQEGKPFAQAAEEFRSWCGPDAVIITWGFDDIRILQENLMLYDLDIDWTEKWYNAQMIFNAQTQTGTSQKALAAAMEYFQIAPTRPAHDALSDAFHTALVCAHLDMRRGMADYDASLKAHEDGPHGALLPGCISRRVCHGYADKRDALEQISQKENECPVCGEAMQTGKWVSQQGRRYLTLCHCPEHGDYLLRVRLAQEEDGSLRASRMLYEPDEQLLQSYHTLRRGSRRRAKK